MAAAPSLAKRLLGMQDMGPRHVAAETMRLAALGVAATLSPAEVTGMATRQGPRRSAMDWRAWQSGDTASNSWSSV